VGGVRTLSGAGVLSSARRDGPGPHARGAAFVKVLLADDDRLIRAMLGDLLAELGHEVTAAADGAEAVAACARFAPDLVILDFLMPRLSGLDALKELRRSGLRAPAVLLTAITDGSLREVEGVDVVGAVLEKPFTRRTLERAIARAMRAP